MNEYVLEIAVAASTAAIATWILARLAPRWRWADDPARAPSRKRQARSVPPVGGTAILLGLAAVELVRVLAHRESLFASIRSPVLELVARFAGVDANARASDAWFVWSTLLAAACVGWIDDVKRGGLSALQKCAAQIVPGVGLAFAAGLRASDERFLLGLLACVCLAVLAQNALNTFDNQDGAATSLTALGLCAALPSAAAAACGFLPFNLWVRTHDRPSATRGTNHEKVSTPIAYLGDSGSHLLGVLLVLSAGGTAALCLPLFDLARVAWVRWKLGLRPWAGDRRHLAHRLEARGLSRTSIVLVLLAIAAPAVLATLLCEHAILPAVAVPIGIALTALAFVATVVASTVRDGR